MWPVFSLSRLLRAVDEADAELERRALRELDAAGFAVEVLTSRQKGGAR
jgi:hypothetical protein